MPKSELAAGVVAQFVNELLPGECRTRRWSLSCEDGADEHQLLEPRTVGGFELGILLRQLSCQTKDEAVSGIEHPVAELLPEEELLFVGPERAPWQGRRQ